MNAGLYVVATPIGNLEDISGRALRILGGVDMVLAEDTRRTRTLLQHYGIRNRLQSLHDHNEEQFVPRLLDSLEQGESLALVSDAGTPLISDPGFKLVRAAQERGIPVYAVPGPSSITAALSVAGMATDRFAFEGFPPARGAARRRWLDGFKNEKRTLVFFESSHRIVETMAELAGVMGGNRLAAVCRELTKQFETVLHGSLDELAQRIASDPDQRKGEFVIIVGGSKAPGSDEPDREQAIEAARVLMDYLPASQAARAAARLTGVPRREIFNALGDE